MNDRSSCQPLLWRHSLKLGLGDLQWPAYCAHQNMWSGRRSWTAGGGINSSRETATLSLGPSRNAARPGPSGLSICWFFSLPLWDAPFMEISPWLDSMLFNSIEEDLATLKAQTHRRYIKSHLPFNALPVWDTVKYIHVGRDGRDARLSWQNHEQGFTPEFGAHIGALAMALAAERGEKPAGPPPSAPEDPRDYLVAWFDEIEAQLDAPDKPDGRFGAQFFIFEETYWRERNRPNLLLVHYNDLKEDLAGEMRRIAVLPRNRNTGKPDAGAGGRGPLRDHEEKRRRAFAQDGKGIRSRCGQVHQPGPQRTLAGISEG